MVCLCCTQTLNASPPALLPPEPFKWQDQTLNAKPNIKLQTEVDQRGNSRRHGAKPSKDLFWLCRGCTGPDRVGALRFLNVRSGLSRGSYFRASLFEEYLLFSGCLSRTYSSGGSVCDAHANLSESLSFQGSGFRV